MPRKTKLLIFLIPFFFAPSRHIFAISKDEAILQNASRFTVFIERVTTVPFNATRSGYSSGAGFIIDKNQGLVVTNRHVAVQGIGQTKLHFKNQAEVEARTVYTDARYDLAILKFDPSKVRADLAEATMGNSDEVPIGREVATFGNPFEFRFSASKGIISATDRRDTSALGFVGEFFQTDAEINPGNSGGPLIDLSTGLVIGINTFDYSDANANKVPGLGFSLKVNAVRQIIGKIVRGEKSPGVGWAGMDIHEIPRHRVVRHYGLPSHQANRDKYLLIGRLTIQSPAQSAGFRAQDLILETEPKARLNNETDLENFFNSHVGTNVRLRVLRKEDAAYVSHWITLNVFNKNEDQVRHYVQVSGMTLHHIPIDYREQFGIAPQGVFVSAVQDGSQADLAGITREDIITSVNGITVNSLADFYRQLNLRTQGKSVEINIKRFSRWRPDRFFELEIDQVAWVDVDRTK